MQVFRLLEGSMKGKLNALVLGGLVALAPVTAFANAVFDQLFVSDGANGIASDSGNGFPSMKSPTISRLAQRRS
ncbi:hypothetical protein E6W36_08575 [Hankyongella ginsenosidimutans]|uniref:Uncharacterized protein n=1 Tax=Hankyongella ginsenosidimutans TaxID=1763828 RepID=A0A4D7C9I1_9SPHN|nr:hypothetical protein [Hankyongella ginsenosidimutans]QCI79577.1 hypothetical protein E6W36_08575 [Hankyongella ginsenosidimutans]